MIVLVINAGSSSLRASLHDVQPGSTEWDGSAPPAPIWDAHVEWSPPPSASTIRINARVGHSRTTSETSVNPTLMSPVDGLSDLLTSMWHGDGAVVSGPGAIEAIGHRIVYAGAEHRASEYITPAVRAAIAHAAEYAPAHDAIELTAVDAALNVFGSAVPQLAVFDTAFHATIAPAAYTYAIPYRWLEQGIRRYGFHGVSHQYAARRAAHMLDREPRSLRVVTCHLGSGCSLAAVSGGRSVDTTMGFTPLDGVVMATRSGAVDPGILIHLLRHEGYTADTLDRMLNSESGLLGLSGSSGDMRTVAAARDAGDKRAILAVQVYVHRVRQAIAAMTASMGGIDALVFTAGVGEHAFAVRAEICAGLEFLGVKLDANTNSNGGGDVIVSTPTAATPVLVVHAEENWAIAVETARVIGAEPPRPTTPPCVQ
ncbi:MAG: acetate/propionate family kinase [Gemmatimonadaceae bacterium]